MIFCLLVGDDFIPTKTFQIVPNLSGYVPIMGLAIGQYVYTNIFGLCYIYKNYDYFSIISFWEGDHPDNVSSHCDYTLENKIYISTCIIGPLLLFLTL